MLSERLGGMTADELEARMGAIEWIERHELEVMREEERRFSNLDAKGKASLQKQLTR